MACTPPHSLCGVRTRLSYATHGSGIPVGYRGARGTDLGFEGGPGQGVWKPEEGRPGDCQEEVRRCVTCRTHIACGSGSRAVLT
eukprot:2713116-Rhodomonas_salina.3